MSDRIHQALYGYASGHRLLASSIAIPPDAGRLLRAATDAVIDHPDRHYLSVFPLPELRAQAFVRTWPAEAWLRPGSVWSHVLLVDFVSLAALDRLNGLLNLFHRPRIGYPATDPEIEAYEQPLQVSALREPLTPTIVDVELASRVFRGIYGTGSRLVVAVPDTMAAEATLMAMYEQQWPALRRKFAFRTRTRSSDGPIPFDLELVERSRGAGMDDEETAQPWLNLLLDDVAHPGRSDLRRFLRSFGPEALDGRRILPKLVTVFQRIVAEPAPFAVEELCRDFPSTHEMARLKRTLLGKPAARGWQPPLSWPSDPDRLQLLFAAPPNAVDFGEMRLDERIAACLDADPAGTTEALQRIDLARLPTEQVQGLVAAATRRLDDFAAAALATNQPDLGVLLVAQRPGLLGSPELWNALDNDLLLEVFARTPGSEQAAVQRALLSAGAVGVLTTLCEDVPQRWWHLLLDVASTDANLDGIAQDAGALREVLARVGAAAIGGPHRQPHTRDEMVALLLSADLTAGLWRHVPAREWLQLWTNAKAGPASLPRQLRDRLLTVALLAAAGTGPRELRIEAWLSTFTELHLALARSEFDPDAWFALEAALPSAPDWDRCLRLRRGAVGEMRRDRWDATDIGVILDAAGSYREDILRELQEVGAKKKSKGWLRDLIDILLP